MLPHRILFCSCVYSIPYPSTVRKGIVFDFSQTFSNRQLFKAVITAKDPRPAAIRQSEDLSLEKFGYYFSLLLL